MTLKLRGISNKGFQRLAQLAGASSNLYDDFDFRGEVTEREEGRYAIKEIFCKGLTTYQNADWGEVLIGGNHCDLYIDGAYPEDGGVRLTDVHLLTGVDLGFDEFSGEDLGSEALREDFQNFAVETIMESYDSIEGETFTGEVKW